MFASVDWGSLWEATYVSAIVGFAVLLIATLAVIASMHMNAAREQGNNLVATVYGVATGAGVLALLAIVAWGITIMADK